MNRNRDIVSSLLADSAQIESLEPAHWDLAIRQARQAGLLAHLHYLLGDRSLYERLPEPVRAHLRSAAVSAEKLASSVHWEVHCIHRALIDTGVPVILLKGAAYLMCGLPPARGRLFHDVDIMVPKAAIDDVERQLVRNGWRTTHTHPYDQRYYRTWMHELPPLKHFQRESVLDVHHTILPETARLKPDPRKLLQAARPLAGFADTYVLAPADMVLHSATHLFHDGELEHGLRDLVDIDGLLRHFGADDAFWPELTQRAQELDLTRPLYYGLRHVTKLLRTPVPSSALDDAQTGRPKRWLSPLMEALFSRALAPPHASCDDSLTAVARFLLYVRSHFLRMPLHLLIPHLARKAVMSRDDANPMH